MTPKTIIGSNTKEIDMNSKLWNEMKNNIVLNNSSTFDKDGMITGGNSNR